MRNLINLTLHVGAGLCAPAPLTLIHSRFLRQGAASPSLSFSLEEYENPSNNAEIWKDRICLTRGVYSRKIQNHTPYILCLSTQKGLWNYNTVLGSVHSVALVPQNRAGGSNGRS